MVLGAFLFLLVVLAFAPPFLVHLGKYEGPYIDRLSDFIENYDGIILSLGTIFLISILTVWATVLSARSNEARERANRKVSAELKISEYRQAWIDSMREDLTRFAQLNFHRESIDDTADLYALNLNIRLRLNLKETHAINLYRAMAEMTSTSWERKVYSKSGKVISTEKKVRPESEWEAHGNFAEMAHIYLKFEWERLKEDIRKAQLSDQDS